MPTDLTSEEMAKLLMILEAAEQEVHDRSLFAIRQLADLHEETKSELANSIPKDRNANPIVERIATAAAIAFGTEQDHDRGTVCSNAQVTCRVPSQARKGSGARRRATVSLRSCAAAFR
jgi:hypothetical protein